MVDVVVTWQVGSHRRAKRRTRTGGRRHDVVGGRLVAVGGGWSMCGWGGDGRGLGQQLFMTEEGGGGGLPVISGRGETTVVEENKEE